MSNLHSFWHFILLAASQRDVEVHLLSDDEEADEGVDEKQLEGTLLGLCLFLYVFLLFVVF